MTVTEIDWQFLYLFGLPSTVVFIAICLHSIWRVRRLTQQFEVACQMTLFVTALAINSRRSKWLGLAIMAGLYAIMNVSAIIFVLWAYYS